MLCPETTAAAITAAAVSMAQGRSSDDIGLLGTVFTQLGDTLATISVLKAKCEELLPGR